MSLLTDKLTRFKHSIRLFSKRKTSFVEQLQQRLPDFSVVQLEAGKPKSYLDIPSSDPAIPLHQVMNNHCDIPPLELNLHSFEERYMLLFDVVEKVVLALELYQIIKEAHLHPLSIEMSDDRQRIVKYTIQCTLFTCLPVIIPQTNIFNA